MPTFTLPDDPSRQLRELVEAGRFREALEVHRATTDPGQRQQPEAELLAATAATRLGEFGTGVTLAESALERFRIRADGDGRMRARNLLGAIAFEQGRLEEAEGAFGDALGLARELDDSQMSAHASNNLASIADMQGRAEMALSLYRIALLAYQRLGDRRGAAQTCHNLALTFRQMQEWRDAEDAALEAVRHAEQVDEASLLSLALTGRAELHLIRRQRDLARSELARAEAIARAAQDEIGLVEIMRVRALLALGSGEAGEAANLAEEARARAEELRVVQLQAECAAVAARAHRALGRPDVAEIRRTEATSIFGRLGALRLLTEFARQWAQPDN